MLKWYVGVIAFQVVVDCCDPRQHRQYEINVPNVQLCKDKGGIPSLELLVDSGGHEFIGLKSCALPCMPELAVEKENKQ